MSTHTSRAIRALLALALLAALGAVGCSKTTTPRKPNQPPLTQVFLQDPIDTMSYRVRLHWSGNDPDGDVKGFEIQFTRDGLPPADTSWKFTTVTDSIFALPIPDRAADFTFWVRAVDNAGEHDPHPAHLHLDLTNHAPMVEFYNLPHRSHGGIYHFLPVVTFQWRGSDPEGQNTIRNYHLWLDGGAAGGSFDTLLAQSDTVFTLRMEHFGDVSTTRQRTVHLSVIDEAQAQGDTVSYTWQVDAYVTNGTRVLLIDDYNKSPSLIDNTSPMDSMYRNTVNELTGGRYTLYETFDQDNFRFPADAEELFRHFDLVVWYNEATALPTNLNVCGDAVRHFLERGGRLFLSALSVVGQDRILSDEFHNYYLGVRQAYCAHPAQPTDCNYTLRSNLVLKSGNPAAPTDSLANSSGFVGFVDFFVPADSTVQEFYLPYQKAGDDTTELGYVKGNHVGVATRTVAGGGRTTFSSIALHKMTKFGNRDAVLRRLLQGLQAGYVRR